MTCAIDSLGLTPTDIAAMCQDLSRELRRKDVQRTAAERLGLALNVAAILDRVAERITGERHRGTQTPERECVVNKEAVGKSFLGWVDKEIESARHRAVERATELMLGRQRPEPRFKATDDTELRQPCRAGCDRRSAHSGRGRPIRLRSAEAGEEEVVRDRGWRSRVSV